MEEVSTPSFVQFWVPGRPVPKQRPRFGSGRVYTPRGTTAYEELVAICARNAGAVPNNGPVAVAIHIYTKSRCDLDNCIKAILDGLNGVAFHDDRQVSQIVATKNTATEQEGAYVIVHKIGTGD